MGRPMETSTFDVEPAPTSELESSFPLQQTLQVLQILLTVLVTLASMLVLMVTPPILVLTVVTVLMVVVAIPSLFMVSGGQVTDRAIRMLQNTSERAWQVF